MLILVWVDSEVIDYRSDIYSFQTHSSGGQNAVFPCLYRSKEVIVYLGVIERGDCYGIVNFNLGSSALIAVASAPTL